MKKRVIACLLMLAVILPLCASTDFSQPQRPTRSAQTTGLKPGFYFTIDTCRACYYAKWKEETLRLFQEKGLGASIYEGKEIEAPTEKFAPLKAFARQGLWSDLVWVGPFESETAATQALDKFPAVLAFVQRKRSKAEGAGNAGWPVSDSERVTRATGNDYKYGFFVIKGYRLFV